MTEPTYTFTRPELLDLLNNAYYKAIAMQNQNWDSSPGRERAKAHAMLIDHLTPNPPNPPALCWNFYEGRCAHEGCAADLECKDYRPMRKEAKP